MSTVRSNKMALLIGAVFFTFLLGLSHLYMASPTMPVAPSKDNSGSKLVPEKAAAAATTAIASVPTDDITDTSAGQPAIPAEPEVPETPETVESPAAVESPDAVETPEVVETPEMVETPAAVESPEAVETPVQIDELKEEPTEPEGSAFNVENFRPEQWVFPAVKPDAPEYAPYGHWPSKLPSDKPIWTESLGKKLCVIDLESRSFNKPGELWSDAMTWNRSSEVHGPSGGTLNHWVYSKIHGYEYYYVKINQYADRRDSWKKPSVLSKILKKHDVCVFIDSDALFNRLDLPLEWLMNYWSITPQNNSLALPIDPDTEHNLDRFGKLFLNTGFMIMQNHNKTYEIFKDWDDCPNDNSKYPGCTEFRQRKGWQPTDQGGFGTFIRYDYPNDILELPCTEANGFPESNTGCNGKFIKHVWLGKEDRLVLAVGAVFPGVLLETFHKQFLAEKDSFYTTEDELMADGPAFT